MARSVRGSLAAAVGRGGRFSSAPSDYRMLLPTLPSGESMQQCVFLHGDLARRPYRLEDFREPLEDAGIIKNITGIGAYQMNHVWLVKLRSKADKDALVKTGGLQVKGGFCAVIDPVQQDVTVKVHWVDFAVQSESFRQALSSFGDVLDVSNDNWSVTGFEHATSTTRVVRMRLKEGVELDDLPHLFKLGSGTVLLVAPGRSPLCLRCRRQGHIRRDCQTPRCGVCRAFGHESNDCARSYARVTKTALPTEEVQENVMDAEEAEKSAPNSNTKECEDKARETDAEKTGGTTPDSRDLTTATAERAEIGCTQESLPLSQASEEEDMSDSTEITTAEYQADATGATAGRGKRPRTGIPKLTEDNTERKVKRLERQWHRVAGAKGDAGDLLRGLLRERALLLGHHASHRFPAGRIPEPSGRLHRLRVHMRRREPATRTGAVDADAAPVPAARHQSRAPLLPDVGLRQHVVRHARIVHHARSGHPAPGHCGCAGRAVVAAPLQAAVPRNGGAARCHRAHLHAQQNVLGRAFTPLALSMGVPWQDCADVGEVIGIKVVANEFIAYQSLLAKKLDARSAMLATYALSGFGNLCSMGVMLGSLAALCPRRLSDASELAVRALWAGCSASILSACVAGSLTDT
ncbi:uncharacterized protein [Dermacentor albipictus]|uniref:uncharacterized protein isoform X5 n=1 Tax=Dermacentor albipictus TaxID=60249 RepID=UPI0038FD1588